MKYFLKKNLVRRFFFETAGTIMALMIIGRYLESIAKRRTSYAITELLGLQAKTAILLTQDQNGNIIEKEISVKLLQKGDIVKVLPGAKIPADGVIESGKTSVDQSMITGESDTVVKGVGDTVIGGTVNKDGLITVKLNKVGSETMLAQIVKLVKESQTNKVNFEKKNLFIS